MAGFREQATGRVRRDLCSGLSLALVAAWMLLPCGSCVPAGHCTSFVYLPYAQWESLCFIKRKLHMD